MEWVLMKSMSESEQRAVLARCRRQRFGKGEVVFREGDIGDSAHFVASGSVAVRVFSPMGEVVTLDVLHSGDAFGEQALIGESSERSATVVALERCETMRLARSDFEALWAEQLGVAWLLFGVLDARLRATSQALLDALYVGAESRVLRRLARLAEIYAKHPSGAIPLTQDDLHGGHHPPDRQPGATPTQHDGIVNLARGRVEITDRAALARRAH
jgi:CRP/FNR family cyclic AMP-dependent transcriptional regulator